MTAYNGRLKPKRVGGLPVMAVLLFVIALPLFVLATIIQVKVLSIILFIASAFALTFAIFFFVLGDDAPFFMVYIKASRENNNVTSETWTRY